MKKTFTVKNLTLTAMFMALNIVMSSFGVPVPGGHFYLNDVIICTASILLDPFSAFIVGGLGAIIMVVGYSLGRAFIYSTPEYAILKLPYQILQAAIGAVVSVILCFPCKLRGLYLKATCD